MNQNLTELKEEFLVKRDILEHSRKQLKTEFIGIDYIIDQVIDNVSSWYSFSHLQDKPTVINLWGLTGVGKTSLVNRLVELIDWKNKYFKFDMGAKESHLSFGKSLSSLCDNKEDDPLIIALDEFQHSRTVKGPFREDIDNDKNRMVWELIDSGEINYIDWKRGVWFFEELIQKLQYLLIAGVVVQNGVIVEGLEIYEKEMHVHYEKGDDVFFFPEDNFVDIIEYSPKSMEINLIKDVRKTMAKLSDTETILFLKKLLSRAKRPSVKNFSQSLIFILGNIDEAYTMSDDYSADVSADEFHEMSKKITIPKMKIALQSRFRDEQIARFGNIHIIYPALNRDAYMSIIKMELDRICEKIESIINTKLVFGPSIIDVIYKEGVYPTQGVRPIFTTIHQMIKGRLTQFISELFDKELNVDTLIFSIQNDELTCDFSKNTQTILTKSIKIEMHLEKLRANRMDDRQAITAVHESGHAILSAALLNIIPEVVYSVTSDADNNGFMYSKTKWEHFSRKEILPKTAMLLGGHIAEELVFGKENVTSGASSDISKATGLVSGLVKKGGLGNHQMRFINPGELIEGYNEVKEIDEEVKQLITEAKELARITLKKEMKLLLIMSNYLSDNRTLKKDKIEELVYSHLVSKVNIIKDGNHVFYRDHLKKMVESNIIEKTISFNNNLSLNNDLDEMN